MPIENLGTKHLTAAQKTAIDDALTALTTALTSVTQNLTNEERSKYGSVNEQNKLFVNKVADYHANQPALQSSDVDWVEFDKDFADRQFADTRENTLRGILRMLTDFKIVHDFDNYQNGLTDYEYSQYKANTSATGFAAKVAELKQFFPRTGTGTTTPANKT
jgi:uncharacterized FlgJ-related protein